MAASSTAGVAETLTKAAGVQVVCGGPLPGVAAEGQTPSGLYLAGEQPWIWLRQDRCDRIRADLARRPTRSQLEVTRRGLAWLVLAHEVAHHHGYDHGETTLPAECAGFRYYLRPLMRDAGLPATWVDARWKAVKLTQPCAPWTPVPREGAVA